MDRVELQRLLDAGDSYGLMLEAIRVWGSQYHPEADQIVLVAERGREGVAIQVPVNLHASAFRS